MAQKEKPTITQTLEELNAGIFLQQVEEVMKQTALGVIYHGTKGKKGKVTLTISMERSDDPDHQDMVNVQHSWLLDHPTKRGKKTELNTSSTPMHVSRDGYLTIIAYDQKDMYGKLAPVANFNGEK